MIRLLAILALLLPVLALGQATPGGPAGAVMANPTASYGPMIPTNGTAGTTSIKMNGWITGQGLVNLCTYATSTCADTLIALDNVSSTASNANITLSYTVPSSYIGANIVVAGIGYYGAQACTPAASACIPSAGGSSYAAGDYFVVSGGTPSRTASASCSLTNGTPAGTTGVITVTGAVTGTIYPGDVVTGSGIPNATYLNGPIANGPSTGAGAAGTYQSNTATAWSSTTCTFTPRTVFKVLQVTAGAIANTNVVASGSYSATPASGGNITGGVTSGSGTGTVTVPVTYIGLPLQTTISNISSTTVTLGTNALQTLVSSKQWYAFGHDDTATWNLASAAGGSFYVTANKTPSWFVPAANGYGYLGLGQYSQWSFSAAFPTVIDFQGAPLIALSNSMIWSGQLYAPTNGNQFWATGVSAFYNGYLDAMGMAAYNHNHQSSHWHIDANVFRNALLANLYVTSSGNAENNSVTNFRVHNDQTVVPAGAAFCGFIDKGMTDNKIEGSTGSDGCTTGFTTYGADTVTNFIHAYNVYAGNDFEDRNIANGMTGDIADNVSPGGYGFYMHSNSSNVNNWIAFLNSVGTYYGQIPVYLDVSGHNSVGCGNTGYFSIWTNPQIVDTNGVNSNNTIANCQGAAPAPFTIQGLTEWGNVTSAQAVTQGFGLNRSNPPTFTDSSGTGSATNRYEFVLPAVTAASTTAATTYTNDYTMFVPAPAAGTNVTITNPWGYGTTSGENISGPILLGQNNGTSTIGIGTGTTTGQVTIGGGSDLVKFQSPVSTGGTKFANPTLGTCSGVTSTTGGATAGTVVITTGGTGCTIQFTGLLSQSSGFRCSADDETAKIGSVQQAHTPTTCTMYFAGTIANGDTIVWSVVQGF